MSSHSSNNSNADMEVINAEDLEDSPPPGNAGDVTAVEIIKYSLATKEEEVVVETTASEDTDKIGEILDVDEAIVSKSVGEEVAAMKDEDEPPIEKLQAPTPSHETEPVMKAAPTDKVELVGASAVPAAAPVVAAPAPAEVDSKPAADIDETLASAPVSASAPVPASAAPAPAPQPQVVSVRPTVTAERPAASLEEVDNEEEDDDDIDETLAERLVGLTEMFPDFVRNGSVSLVKGSWSLTQSCYSLGRAASWVIFSSATILFMPIMIESERLQMQDQQKAQKNQILLGPGAAVSGGPSLGPPPI